MNERTNQSGTDPTRQGEKGGMRETREIVVGPFPTFWNAKHENVLNVVWKKQQTSRKKNEIDS